MVKKSGKAKKTSVREAGMLNSALNDLNREIANLNKLKVSYKKKEQELKLKVSQLIKTEATLKIRGKDIERKSERLTNRLSKIKKIKFELSEI